MVSNLMIKDSKFSLNLLSYASVYFDFETVLKIYLCSYHSLDFAQFTAIVIKAMDTIFENIILILDLH